MDKIFEQSKDLHVVSTMIYVGSGKAYKDSACTKQYKTSELKEAFIKGAMIQVDTGKFAFPVGYSEASKIGTVTYITPNATTATSADIASAVSVADE